MLRGRVVNVKPLVVGLVTETAKLSERESPRTSSDAILVDMNAGAEVTTTDSL